MQSSYIEAFLSVIQTGSFSKAAEELFITQPTLTHRIQALESELGTQLFVRKQGLKAVELTDTGKRFVNTAQKWSILTSECRNLKEINDRQSLNIGATTTMSNYVMPSVYARVKARDLPVNLNLLTLHFHECYHAVDNKEADLVFVSKALSYPRVSVIPVFSEKMVLLCSHSAPYYDGINPKEIPAEKCTHLFWNAEYGAWHEYWFGSEKPYVHADSLVLIEKMLEKTDLWAIVPLSAASVITKHSDLCYHTMTDAPPDRPIYMLTREPHHEYANYVVEDIITVMTELCKE